MSEDLGSKEDEAAAIEWEKDKIMSNELADEMEIMWEV